MELPTYNLGELSPVDIREYLQEAGPGMDYVLFSNYEAQVDALISGFIDIAWNTNLAYVRTHRRTGTGRFD